MEDEIGRRIDLEESSFARAFYEPMAVFLATLTIWAYSSYTSRSTESAPDSPDSADISIENGSSDRPSRNISHNNDNFGATDDEDAEPAPTFIHLDRPNDDEMVQAFVRFGTASAMRANITGVGDIYSNQGPTKVLKEGRKILSTVSTAWGRTDRYSSVLEALEQIASGRINAECERTAR
ncbi:hypothetical protein E8E13_002340 [Curvularia kusanoi]|uniref:Uncharacterized protein n=1 Tax=Curvularia kusanoi TaxID=90978 RepID=A0A9P4T4I8_CURKU|nr:hypothetical protein E8E13_002340 [Curvularia kusanoi]